MAYKWRLLATYKSWDPMLHSYSFRMGLEPEKSSSIGKVLDPEGHKDHKVWILRLTVLQWMSESMVPPGAPAGHPTGVAPSTTTTSSKFGGSLWLTAPEGVGVTQLGGCFFFEIFQRLNSQAIRFSRFFLKLEQKHLWRIFGERNGKFKLIY